VKTEVDDLFEAQTIRKAC